MHVSSFPTRRSSDLWPELSPSKESPSQELKRVLLHLLMFRAKVGRNDHSTLSHPSLVIGIRAFNVYCSAVGRRTVGGDLFVPFHPQAMPRIVNKMLICGN